MSEQISELSKETKLSYAKKALAKNRSMLFKNPHLKQTQSPERDEYERREKSASGAIKSANGVKSPDKNALKSQLKDLHSKFDPSYEHSDDHVHWKKHKEIHSQITHLKKQIGEDVELDELSTDTLSSYSAKAKTAQSDAMKKGNRSKNLEKAVSLYSKGTKRALGAHKADGKIEVKNTLKSWGVNESTDVNEAIIVHQSKEKDGKEYQVLSRKAGREFVIQSKKKDGSWHSHDAVGSAMRARQLISGGMYSKSKIDEAEKVATVTITVPALIRLCEIAREDIDSDTDLHEFIEAMIEKASGTIDSQTLEDIEGDGDSDEDDIKEGEIVSADKKVGKDGRQYPRSRKTLGKETNSLTGVKL